MPLHVFKVCGFLGVGWSFGMGALKNVNLRWHMSIGGGVGVP